MTAAIEVRHVSRSFGAVKALDDVSLSIEQGKLTSLLGENGAGKSTLLKILAGLQPPSTGEVIVDGVTVTKFDPNVMIAEHGIAIVPQELVLLQDRSVAENILLGVEPGNALFPSRTQMIRESRELLARLGVDVDPRTPISRLDLATQQLVVVARSVARNCRVLILDEPTAMLTPAESTRLFSLLASLKESGVTLVYVSHRMPEVFALSDYVHVLRDGRHVAESAIEDTTPQDVVRAMVGRQLAEEKRRMASEHGEGVDERAAVLRVSELSGDRYESVSLDVAPGEILGIAGLPDSGRVELLRGIFGADKPSSGQISVSGTAIDTPSPARSIANRVAYVPGERRAQGIFATMTVGENVGALVIDQFTHLGMVAKGAFVRSIDESAKKLRVKASSMNQPIVNLSGGNQQKAILARWLSIEPQVMLLDEPTRGIDVGAKSEIYEQLDEFSQRGVAIVCSSSDLPELLAITDRIVVMAAGRVAGILETGDATEEKIMQLATGVASAV